MAQTLLWLIIAFVTLDFIISSVLSWLNTRWMTHPVPPELEGLYDEEKYRKQQDYMRQPVQGLDRGTRVASHPVPGDL